MLSALALKALIFGLLIAVTYPLGALLGIVWSPGKTMVAATVAFGAGTLIPALSIDLIEPHLAAHEFTVAAIGALAGSAIFLVLNDLINNHGGFLRKAGTTITYFKKKKSEEFKVIFEKMSHVTLFKLLPPEDIDLLVPHLMCRHYKKGDVLMKQGDAGDSLFIIDGGSVDIVDQSNGADKKIATLKTNDVVGEIALVTGEPRTATAIAAEDTNVSILSKQHFDEIIHSSNKLAKAIQELVETRINDLREKKSIDGVRADAWVKSATKNIDEKLLLPTQDEIQEAIAVHKGAPFAMWLGNLLDTIPGGVIVGTTLVSGVLSPSLIAGLCFSNFPASLSGALVGQQLNFPKRKIFWDWANLMFLSGLAAYLGNLLFMHSPHWVLVLIDGLTAGVFVNVMSETMLPEAFSGGGAVTGIFALLGFLTALSFDTLT